MNSRSINQIVNQDLRDYLTRIHGHIFQKEMTLCPFHEDSNPSMSVNQKDGAWVFYCHACEAGGNIIHYEMRRNGLTKGEAIKKLEKYFGFENSVPKPRVVAEYVYMDEDGKELYKVLRFEPKSFRADRKMNGISQVLYHLPEVVKASRVWLVEGEKDADSARELGLTATTSPFGLSHWKPEFSRSLKGKEIMICLDVGAEREAEKRAAGILAAGAKEVKIIELPGLEREGQDISDWIELQDSKSFEDLRGLLQKIASEISAFELPDEELKITNEFLEMYIDSISRVTDAPRLFILFSGLGLLSGILSKFFFHYPRKTPLNLYLLLLAPSTFYRKSVTIDIATDYLNAVNPDLLLPESFTSEALLEILSKQSQGLLTWRELIQVKEFQFGSEYNRGLPSLLTDLFDFKPRVRRFTKGEGELIIENPILSILAAGISTWPVENLKKIDFQGGIWTRFLFIPVEEDDQRKFTLPKEFYLNPALEEKLKHFDSLEPKKMDLTKIHPLLQKWGEKHQAQTLRLENDLLRANFQRLEVALLKIACLLQLAEDEATTVEPETFKQAVKIIEYLKRILPIFFEEEVQFTEFDRTRVKIFKFIKKEREVKQNELRRYSHLETKQLNKILDQLEAEGNIGHKPDPNYSGIGKRATVYFYKEGE